MFVWYGKTKREKNKDFVGMPYICEKNGNKKVSLKDKIEIWKEY